MDREQSLIVRTAERFGIAAPKLLATLKTTAFRQRDNTEISDEQMIALLVVAEQHKLNPFTKEIYAFPDKGGIVPVVGVDGWSRLINSHPQFNGMKFENEGSFGPHYDDARNCPEGITCVMYRKDREHPVSATEWLDECYRPPMGQHKTIGPWQTHTKRMLRHKAMIQCARLCFGFCGIYDEDEAERVLSGEQRVDPAKSGTAADLSSALNIEEAEYSEVPEPAPQEPPAAPEKVQQPPPDWLVTKAGLLDRTALAQSLQEIDELRIENDEHMKGAAKTAISKALDAREAELRGQGDHAATE